MSKNIPSRDIPERLISLEELAAHVGVSLHTVRRWINRGYLHPVINIGSIKRFNLVTALAEIKSIPSPKRSSAFQKKTNPGDRLADE